MSKRQELFDFLMDDSDSSSGDEYILRMIEDKKRGEEGSSGAQKRRYLDSKREEGATRLFNDYFSATPSYNEDMFRRRFRMRRSLFERIFNEVHAFDPYFQFKRMCTGQPGLSPHQKITAAMRLLAYGGAADAVDEYLRIGETTSYQCLEHFCDAVVKIFGTEYLREPNAEDMARILEENRLRGFPGMIGSVDCMHWKWKNCPKAWAGSYTDFKGHTSIVFEAVATKDLWIWHAFFGMPGSCNDVNVLNRSNIFDRMMRGETPPVEFVVNGKIYTRPYYLGDGIYPQLATIMKTVAQPVNPKERNYAGAQESTRKDVERAFGAFQGRWAIIRQPSLTWHKERMHLILKACVVLHNMIVEDERDISGYGDYVSDYHTDYVVPRRTREGRLLFMLQEYAKIHDQVEHRRLKKDLIEHLWNIRGDLAE